MYLSEPNLAPTPDETLAAYVRRVRTELSLSQKELAEKAGLHLQSVGKIERGQTSRLNRKPKEGLARALSIPVDYLDATTKGVSVPAITALKICPRCWTPGTLPDVLWTHVRAKYCFACGDALRDRCMSCEKPITSFEFRFCPYCGQSLKKNSVQP
ncbi:MAG TPA: zinc ribbon domain-containing protein [Coleofasciculaceae cyanobacterium]|jgi:DNA-binding XRE family transcriptional regulator